jgi:FkbM family methyltransferase
MLTPIEKITESIKTHFKLFGAKGVLRRALMMFPGMGNEFKATIPRSSRKVFIRLGTTDVAAFEHVFINNEYGFSLTQDPKVIVDAGANVGMSAAYFSLNYPGAKIIAIEPEPGNFSVLLKNAELFQSIVPKNIALWNQDGEVSIQHTPAGSWGTRVTAQKATASTRVRSMKLNTLLKEFHIEHIDLLKVDVEGAECEIFEDAALWMRRVKVVCAELHDRFRPGCSKAFEAATAEFPVRWRQGELMCAAREGAICIQR